MIAQRLSQMTIRYAPVTWAEGGIWLILLIGGMLGTLKRLAPTPTQVSILYDLLSFGLLMYVTVRRAQRTKKLPFSPIIPFLFAFILFATLTLFNPILSSWTRGIFGWRFLCSAMLFHLLGLWAFDNLQQVRRVLTVLWLIMGGTAVYGLLQLVRGYTATELAWIEDIQSTMRIANTGEYRLMGPAADAIGFGFYLSIGLLTLLGVFILSRERIRLWHIAIIAVSFPALIYTFVRAAWVATFIGTLLLVAIWLWRIKQTRPLYPIVLLMGALIVFLLPLIAEPIGNSFENPALRERVSSLSDPLADHSMQERFQKWGDIFNVVEAYPLGIGIGMTGAASLRFSAEPSPIFATMDNSYLKIIIETGWIGLVLFLLLLGSIIWHGLQLAMFLPNELGRTLAWVFVIMFVGFIIILFFGEYIELNPTRTIIWLFTGLLSSLPRLCHDVSTD